MNRPGDRLRALAARVFDSQAMEGLVDPVVADLQAEYGAAVSEGRLWRGRWVRFAGYVAFVKIAVVCGWREVIHGHLAWTADDRRALVRVIRFSIAPIVAVTTLLELPPLLTQSFGPDSFRTPALVTLIPQALTIAVPVGVMLGILFGLRGCASSRRLRRTIVVLAVMCSAASFANIGWVVPDANQSFRVLAATRMGQDPRTVQRGRNELTFSELSRQIHMSKHGKTAVPDEVRGLETGYYSRWAVTFAPLVLALLALSIVRRRWVGRLTLSVAACGACFSYYVLLYLARALVVSGGMPAVIVAWTPNVVIALVAMLMTVTSTPSAKLAR